jgi:hypothetical protein
VPFLRSLVTHKGLRPDQVHHQGKRLLNLSRPSAASSRKF